MSYRLLVRCTNALEKKWEINRLYLCMFLEFTLLLLSLDWVCKITRSEARNSQQLFRVKITYHDLLSGKNRQKYIYFDTRFLSVFAWQSRITFFYPNKLLLVSWIWCVILQSDHHSCFKKHQFLVFLCCITFFYLCTAEKLLFWAKIFKMKILIDVQVLRSLEHENHIFSSWSVCVCICW